RRYFAARESRHHRVEISSNPGGHAGFRALKVAIGSGRLDDDDIWPPRTPCDPEDRAERSRETTDARLHENVRRWRIRHAAYDLARQHAVAVHDVDRDVAVAFVARVGDDGPAASCRLRG